jgi:Na+-driven multidrug efflux pump
VLQSFRFDRGILRRYLRLGTPSGLDNFMNTATFNLFLLMFQSYGVVQGASMAIVFNWDMLSFIPMIAQYFVIKVYGFGPITSWWVFVTMLISLALIYLWRLLGGAWRQPERLVRVMQE